MKNQSETNQYTIVDLGADAWFEVTRVNNAGQVLGYRHFDSSGKQPFLYESGNFTDLSTLGIYPKDISIDKHCDCVNA